MNTIRKWLSCFLMAVVFAGFASVSLATSDRRFILTVTSQQNGQFQATLTNTSLSNASINSFDLFVDLNWTITNPAVTTPGIKFKISTGATPGHLLITNVSPGINSGESITVTFSVNSASCGDGTFRATVWNGTGPTNGSTFDPDPGVQYPPSPVPVACPAALACGDVSAVALFQPAGTVVVARNINNKDNKTNSLNAAACGATSYFASDTFGNNVQQITGLQPDITHYRWLGDGSGGNADFSTAAFSVTVYTSQAAPNTKVGWRYADGTLAEAPGADPNDPNNPHGPVAFVPVQACNPVGAPMLPTPLAKLTATVPNGVSAGTTVQIQVSNLVPVGKLPNTPFAAILGTNPNAASDDNERVKVLSVNGNAWTVVRGDGSTGLQPSHTFDANYELDAMFSPLPLLSAAAQAMCTKSDGVTAIVPCPYTAGTPVPICLADSGSVKQGNTTVFYRKFFDIGVDPWNI